MNKIISTRGIQLSRSDSGQDRWYVWLDIEGLTLRSDDFTRQDWAKEEYDKLARFLEAK